MAHGGDLPNEIVFRILARLPVKSLLRFACVCRQWFNTFMYDRNFAKAQLQATRHQRLLVSTGNCDDDEPAEIQSFHLDTSSFEGRDEYFPHDRQVTLLGSCNGLVFVTPFSGCKWVLIWNPSIYNACKQLPDPKFDIVKHAGHNDFNWNAFFGAGYVADTDDYKLLLAHSEYRRIEQEDDNYGIAYELVMEVKMFSIRSNDWKTIKPPNSEICSREIPATVVSERLHWLSDRGDRAKEMVVFDLGKEEFETMLLPSDGVKSMSLGVSAGGCLCVVRFPNLRMHEMQDAAIADCDSFFDIWVMTEYGVAQSWTKLYRFSYSSPGYCSNLLVKETCTVVALDEKQCTRLTRIEYKDKEEQQFGVYTSMDYLGSMLVYEESLLWFDYDKFEWKDLECSADEDDYMEDDSDSMEDDDDDDSDSVEDEDDSDSMEDEDEF